MLSDIFKHIELLDASGESLHFRKHHNDCSAQKRRRIVVVGGGTAGYLSALAIKRHIDNAEVRVIESAKVPVIGVGEATVDAIIPFLHNYLGLDIVDFYSQVRPTWKFGIRFEWGQPGDHYFNAPFEWSRNSIGLRGSLEYHNDINYWNEQSVFMDRNLVPFFKLGDEIISFLHKYKFAYHLDNRLLIQYLKGEALKRGIPVLDREIVEVVSGDGSNVDYLMLDGAEKVTADYFIDCSGFKSLLLEKSLKSPYISFGDSLLTDTAVTFNTPHGGRIKPYTTAKTMSGGWCWIIPTRTDDHCGYVFSSQFCTPEDAQQEVREKFREVKDFNLVRFRSGRHERFWIGNTIAVGNAYAFVEPLESSGILMICTHIKTLIKHLGIAEDAPEVKEILNQRIAVQWDKLRWFLAIHYKFNKKYSTPFWDHVTRHTNIQGMERILNIYREGAPLSLRQPALLDWINSSGIVPFYGIAGIDCILLGQKVPARLLPVVEEEIGWKERRDAVDMLLQNAISQADALDHLDANPDSLHAFMSDPGTWINKDRKYFEY